MPLPRRSAILAAMTPLHFDYNGHFVIALTSIACADDDRLVVARILDDCWTHRITNVLVLQNCQQKVLLHTYFPYTADHCEQSKPVEHNFFAQSAFGSVDRPHFPFKFANLYACPLRVSSYHLAPHMIFRRTDGLAAPDIDGIDGITLRVLADKLNFQPIVVPASLNPFLAKLKENDSFSESYPLKLPRSLDMVITVIETLAAGHCA